MHICQLLVLNWDTLMRKLFESIYIAIAIIAALALVLLYFFGE